MRWNRRAIASYVVELLPHHLSADRAGYIGVWVKLFSGRAVAEVFSELQLQLGAGMFIAAIDQMSEQREE